METARLVRTSTIVAAVGLWLASDPAVAAELRGTVRDARSGLPLDGVLLELAATPLQATSAREGTFALAGVPPGGHRLRATLAGYGRVEVELPAAGWPV